MRKIINTLLAAAAVMGLASCSLHDDKELFGDSAAERIQKTVADDKALLESADNGWELHLWNGKDYSGGGYTYFLKFSGGKVTVAGDIAPSKMRTTSSYDIIRDQGPVLTINTFNEIFHYNANPSMQDDDGEQQDYEFIIQRTTADSVYLKGKKWGNKMVMTRVPANISWTARIDSIQSLEDNMMLTFATAAKKIKLSTSRVAEFSDAAGYDDIPYVVTPTGIQLQRPVDVDGQQVSAFTYSVADTTLTAVSTPAPVVAHVVLPPTYVPFNDFAGSYKLIHYLYKKDGTRSAVADTVQLVPVNDGQHYNINGLIDGASPRMTYDKVNGSLSLMGQVLANRSDGTQVMMCPWSIADGGYFYFTTQFGMTVARDLKYKGMVLSFKPTSASASYKIDSFILVDFSGEPSNNTYQGPSSILSFGRYGYGLRSLSYLVKISQ